MELLNSISKRIRSESNWIDVATKIGIDVNDIDKIKEKNNCATEFVYTLTNKIWNVIFEFVKITSNNNGFVNITCIDKLAQIICGNIEAESNKRQVSKNLLREIANRLGDWKRFARILGLEESKIFAIEKKFPLPDFYIQRTLEVINQFSKPLPPSTSWEFWRQYLKQFEDGQIVIEEIEIKFPTLLAEVSDTGAHMITTEAFSYIGHPFENLDSQSIISKRNTTNIPVCLGGNNIVEFQSIFKWRDTKQQYTDRYSILKEINAYNFIHIGNNNCPILITLKSHLNHTNDIGFVVKGYHFIDHICLFKPGLFAKDIFDDHYFCFIANDGVVLYITECSQGKGHAIYHSIRNIQIANLLHKELNSNEILQINVIVYNDDEDDEFCKSCSENNLFVKRVLFTHYEMFLKWYQELKYTLIAKLNNCGKGITEKKDSICEAIKKDMLTYEALENTDFPSFSYCPEDQVKELEKIILLTPQQQIVLLSNVGYILIRGCYGSGKTVVLHKRFEIVVENGKIEDIYYLICNDQQSELIHFMRRVQAKFPNKKIIVCQSKDILPSQVIPKLSNLLNIIKGLWKDKTVHIFIDEFDGFSLNKGEVTKIKEALNFFLNSHIVIALQSMEEHIDFVENETDVDVGYQYSILTKETSFSLFNLTYPLRSSFEINNFVKTTTSVMESIKRKSSIGRTYQSTDKFVDKEYGTEIYDDGKIDIGTSKQKTFYTYNLSKGNTHNVKSGPVNVYFFNKYRSSVPKNMCQIYLSTLTFVLEEASVRNKFAISTYSKELYNAVFHFLEESNWKWTNKISDFIDDNAAYEVLLTDYASVRGYEFVNFVFMVPLGTKILRYRIVESLTRATTHLTIITDNSNCKNNFYPRRVLSEKSSVDMKLIKSWRQSEVCDFFDVKFCKSKDVVTIVKDKTIIFSMGIKDLSTETSERFPWSQGVALPYGYDVTDDFVSGLKSILFTDDVDLCKEFLRMNNVDINMFDNSWKENLLELLVTHNAVKIRKYFVDEYHLDIHLNVSSEYETVS